MILVFESKALRLLFLLSSSKEGERIQNFSFGKEPMIYCIEYRKGQGKYVLRS